MSVSSLLARSNRAVVVDIALRLGRFHRVGGFRSCSILAIGLVRL